MLYEPYRELTAPPSQSPFAAAQNEQLEIEVRDDSPLPDLSPSPSSPGAEADLVPAGHAGHAKPRANVCSTIVRPTAELVEGQFKPVKLLRFRTPKKSESFLAPAPRTYDDMLALVKRECPSLVDFPARKLRVHLVFEDDPPAAQGVVFRITPDAWPHAMDRWPVLAHVRKVADPDEDGAGKDKTAASVTQAQVQEGEPVLKMQWQSCVKGQADGGEGENEGGRPNPSRSAATIAAPAAKTPTWQDLVDGQAVLEG